VSAPRIGAILLAAGSGSRFGGDGKLLAELDGAPLVRHAALAIRDAGLAPAVAVLGARAEAVREALRAMPLRFVVNAGHADGLSGSLKAGIAALQRDADAAVVVLGDMPRIDAALLGRLAAAYRAAQPRPGAVVPVHGGRRGNPVLLDLAILASELEALTGDAGAGRSLARRDDVIEIEGGPGCLLDIDTAQALDALRRR